MKILFKNKYGELRSCWALAIAFFGMFAAQMIGGMIVSIIGVIIIGPKYIASNPTQEQMDALAIALKKLALEPYVMTIIYILSILSTILIYKLLYKRPFSQMGMSVKKGWVKELLHGMLFGIVIMSIIWGVLLVTGQVKFIAFQFSGTIVFSVAMWFVNFVAVAFNEEMLTRGLMMTSMKTTRNKILIAIVPSFLFSMMHIMNPGMKLMPMINLFLAGVLFSYTFLKTRRIWLAIGCHITWNFFQGNIFGMLVSGLDTPSIMQMEQTGSEILGGGAFGPEGGVVVTIVMLLGLLYVRFCIKTPEETEWTIESELPLVRSKANERN